MGMLYLWIFFFLFFFFFFFFIKNKKKIKIKIKNFKPIEFKLFTILISNLNKLEKKISFFIRKK